MPKPPPDPDTPREMPWGSAFAWAALIPVFVGSWAQGSVDFFWPIFPIGAWGLALAREFQSVHQHNTRLEQRLGAGASVALPPPPVAPPVTPAPPPIGGGSGETGPLVPAALRPLSDEVERLTRHLLESGRGQVAESLEVGLREVIRLTHLRAQLGDVDAALAEARQEASRLEGQAAKATDAEARSTWQTSAEAAARRVVKIEALRGTDERAAARIESFRQLVKSLAVDMARQDLTELGETPTLADLADQAHRVDREIEALHHTNDELRTLSAARRTQGA